MPSRSQKHRSNADQFDLKIPNVGIYCLKTSAVLGSARASLASVVIYLCGFIFSPLYKAILLYTEVKNNKDIQDQEG